MLLRYRSTNFSLGSATFTESCLPTFNADLQRSSQTDRILVRGNLQLDQSVSEGAAPAALVALVDSLRAALTSDGGDLTITFPDGTIYRRYLSSSYVGGLRVTKGPDFPETGPGELIRKRAFEIEFTGEKLVVPTTAIGGAGAGSISFSESLTFDGTGGPRFVMVETMDGALIKQQVNARTVARCRQEGRAVRAGSYPNPPPPVFPNDERLDLRNIVYANPGGGNKFEAAWSYVFESANSLKAFPNR